MNEQMIQPRSAKKKKVKPLYEEKKVSDQINDKFLLDFSGPKLNKPSSVMDAEFSSDDDSKTKSKLVGDFFR